MPLLSMSSITSARDRVTALEIRAASSGSSSTTDTWIVLGDVIEHLPRVLEHRLETLVWVGEPGLQARPLRRR